MSNQSPEGPPQPPPKIETKSANTNPNQAPKGPPPVSQIKPSQSQGKTK